MALSLTSTRSFLIVFFKLGTFCYATRFVVRGFEVLRALPGLLRVGLRCDVDQKSLSFFFSSSEFATKSDATYSDSIKCDSVSTPEGGKECPEEHAQVLLYVYVLVHVSAMRTIV